MMEPPLQKWYIWRDAMNELFFIIIFSAIMVVIVIAILAILILMLLPKYRNAVRVSDYSTLIGVLKSIIMQEIELYEKDVFENRATITNANFDNYYKELSNRIISFISPQLIRELEYYITYDCIITLVARSVKIYLSSRVGDPV